MNVGARCALGTGAEVAAAASASTMGGGGWRKR